MSGSSTPRESATPPPGSEGPRPLTIATHFLKRYYQTIASDPEANTALYQPSSILSAGVGSDHAEPETYENLQGHQLKDRFVQKGFEGWSFAFEFANGAIDAQASENGILLVATGHVVYVPPENGEDLDDSAIAQQRRKGFVHTFILAKKDAPGGKKTFAVQNDILRFLQDDEEKTVVASNTTPATVSVDDLLPTQPPPATVEETPEAEVPEPESTAEEEKVTKPESVDMAPGGGVEESKEMMDEEEEKPSVQETSEEDIGGEEPAKETPAAVAEETKATEPEATVEETPTQPAPAAKPAPGSWASIAASSSSAPAASAPSTPARTPQKPKPTPPPPPSPAPTKPPTSSTENSTANNGKAENNSRSQRNNVAKRDPDCTLVIKNISAETTDADVRAMFEPYAGANGAKVIGMTVFGSRAIGFVDYDSPKPVLAAVEDHKATPKQLHGRTLDIYQKTAEQKNRQSRGGRGGFRGGQGGNSRQYRRSGSGAGRGDQQKGRGRGGRSS